jgi:hypothetical protein
MESNDDFVTELAQLRELLRRADVGALEFFDEEKVATHPDLPDVRRGRRLSGISGVSLPRGLRLAYVNGENPAGAYHYVVIWRHPGAEVPDSYAVATEEDAKSAILKELRAMAGATDGS